MPRTYAYSGTRKTTREPLFIRPLTRTLRETLGEATTTPTQGTSWKAYCLRPEVATALDALRTRYAANSPIGVSLTPSEVIAVVLVEALPRMTAGEFRPAGA